MLKLLFRIILIAVLSFACMFGYDLWKERRSQPQIAAPQQQAQEHKKADKDISTPPKQARTEKASEEAAARKKEKSIVKSVFLAILPERSTWPEPAQKFYLLTNMEDVIDPIRAKSDWVSLTQMSQDIPHALIAIEDHNFYNHGAISTESIIRAFLVNISAGKVVQGGSTLTQQLVKNIFLSPEQTFGRKAEELFFSLVLEHQYSKDEILELYLNTTYFGAGSNGISQACQKYFGKAPAKVNLAEAAVIAALPYAPSLLNPLENPGECKKRQTLVLKKMQSTGFISEAQYKEALAQRIWLSNGKVL